MTGFTGVRWDARPAERLSRELSAGAGAGPMFEAGMSWASIGMTLHDLAVEFEHLRKQITEGWRGKGDVEMRSAIDRIARWVSDTADLAARKAQEAERQAVAHTVAVAAMPDADVISSLGKLEEAMRAVAAPPGSMIAGGLARLDDQAAGMKAQAARVMASYEDATAPMSTPTQPVPAPAHLVRRTVARQVTSSAEQKIAAQQALGMSGQQAVLAQVAAMGGTALTERTSNDYVSQTRRGDGRVEVTQAEETVVGGRSGQSMSQSAVEQSALQSVPVAPTAGASASTGSNAHTVPNTTYAAVQDAITTGPESAAPRVIGVPDVDEDA